MHKELTERFNIRYVKKETRLDETGQTAQQRHLKQRFKDLEQELNELDSKKCF